MSGFSGFNTGEYIEATLASGSATSLTTATAKTVISISLTAGDWDIAGVVLYQPANTTSVTALQGSFSLVTNTLDTSLGRFNAVPMGTVVYDGATVAAVPMVTHRLVLSGTTTVYLIGRSVFTASTNVAYGIIRARRLR
jgi:hypothetical protein